MEAVFPPVYLRLSRDGNCSSCGRSLPPVVTGGVLNVNAPVRLCEPCTNMFGWFWRAVDDAQMAGHGVGRETGPSAIFALIVRERYQEIETGTDGSKERIPDLQVPRDVLMVARKDEPGKYGLPGGKIEPGEDPTAALVREVGEETGLVMWPRATESIYRGYSARGRLVEVLLVRGYAGTPTSRETDVAWKPWPMRAHAGMQAAYLDSLEHAFERRLMLQTSSFLSRDLCQPVGKAAAQYLELATAETVDESDLALMNGLRYAMTEEEKVVAELAQRGRVVKAPDARPKASASSLEDSFDGGEGDDDDDGDNEVHRDIVGDDAPRRVRP